MNLYELVKEVNEKTHLGEMEILELVRRNWNRTSEFSTTQAKLLVRLIEKRRNTNSV